MVLTPVKNSHNQFMEFDPTSQRPSADQLEPGTAGENRVPRFRIFGFPLHIDPWFFLTAWLIGGRQEPLWMIVWVLVVLVGVLAHELGHAFVGRRLGLDPWIRLFAFGGMTAWRRSRPLSSGQQILISAAGPAVGIAIGVSVLVAMRTGVFAGASPAVVHVLENVLWVNLGWGVLNLLPILPLDGGHIAASIATIFLGAKGRIGARVLSVVLTVAIGLWALTAGEWWMLMLGVFLTVSNVQGLRTELAATRSTHVG
jgi:Zn-dependent protease